MNNLFYYVVAIVWNTLVLSVILGTLWLVGFIFTGFDAGWITIDWATVWVFFVIGNVLSILQTLKEESR